MGQGKRDIGLDIIRCVAILLVILQHSWSGLDLDVQSGAFSYWFYSALCIGVPLFVMLSGSLNLGKAEETGSFLKRRFRRILLPFFLWATVVFVISAFVGKYPEVRSFRSGVSAFFTGLLEGGLNQAYWYVYMLAGLYLLTPVLQRAFRPEDPDSRKLLGYCLAVWAVVQLLKDLYPAFLPVKYYAFSADLFLGYYLAGAYVRRYLTDRELRRRYGSVGFLAGAALTMLLHAWGHPVRLVEMTEVVCLFMWLSSLEIPEGRLLRETTSLSRYSYTVYLTHVVPVGALCTVFHAPAALAPAAVCLIVAVVEFIFCRLLDAWDRRPKDWIGF